MGPILLVDDNPDSRLTLGQLLQRDGYRVVSLATGDRALPAVLRRPLSLIITEVYLPAACGFEVMRRLRAFTRDLPPIICVTEFESQPTPEARVAADALGARTLFRKSLDQRMLLRAVAEALTDGGIQRPAPVKMMCEA